MTHPSTAHESWTTRSLLQWMRQYFDGRDVESPRVVAELLLAHVLECDRMRLYMEVDRVASEPERTRLRELVARAGRGEPVHYLVGEASFHLRSFEVSPLTLIPQPSTETLVEAVLADRADRKTEPVRIADIGTGTGVIAVTLAAALPEARIVATDLDEAILAVARRNAERFEVADRIEWRVGPGISPLDTGGPFDVICSNPPYVPEENLDAMEAGVREFVPRQAWDGGPSGLEIIAPLIGASSSRLTPGGMLAIEIDASHVAAVRDLAARAELEGVDIRDDHEGHPRVLIAWRARS